MITLVVISEVIADALNAVSWDITDLEPWITRYGVMFNKLASTAYDTAINACIASSKWHVALQVARVAEIDGYWSANIEAKVKQALDNLPMAGNLPTFNGNFDMGHRYLISGFRYAEQLQYALDKWKKVDAFNDFKSIYNSAGKPFLWGQPPSSYYCVNYGPRYYDEAMSTLDAFLKFYELGISGTRDYVITVWDWITVNLWVNTHFRYALNWSDWECEVAFYILALRLKHYCSEISNWTMVTTDMMNRLTIQKFDSPQWKYYGIIHHNPTDFTRRISNTFNAFVALHMYYPIMDSAQRSQFVSMLKDPVRGADGLVESSGLYDSVTKKFRYMSGGAVEDIATVVGCALLFLQGIIPTTGHLFIPAFDERYEDPISMLNKYFRFDAENHKILIPVSSGVLAFQFGDGPPCTANFSNDGVYEVTFAEDWNSVISAYLAYALDTDLIYATPIIKPPPPPPIVEKACSSMGKGWGFRRWVVTQNLWK